MAVPTAGMPTDYLYPTRHVVPDAVGYVLKLEKRSPQGPLFQLSRSAAAHPLYDAGSVRQAPFHDHCGATCEIAVTDDDPAMHAVTVADANRDIGPITAAEPHGGILRLRGSRNRKQQPGRGQADQ